MVAPKSPEPNHAKQQAIAQLESIILMVEALDNADTDASMEDAQQAIQEDPLDVQVRDDWRNPCDDGGDPVEFSILLCTGGPAARIHGALNEHNNPVDPVIEYQDWFTPWIPLTDTTPKQDAALQIYCEQFYFGDC